MAIASVIFIVVLCLVAVLAPYLATHDPNKQNLRNTFAGMSSENWFGTDDLGRDTYSRIIWGARISVIIGVSSVALGGIVGVCLGLVSGYFGGWIDTVVMRFIDMMLAFPGVLLAILIISILGPGLFNLIAAISVWSIPLFARIIRSSVLSIKEELYIEAARSVGAGTLRILFNHVLINSMAPIIVYGTLRVATAILTAAALSFLGLGVQPPTAEWGAMIDRGRVYLRRSPIMVVFPGLAILVTTLAVNLLGDALRDALDPVLNE